MTRSEKWAEYRRIRDAIFSVCWDCPRPCADCREWARMTAFGRDTTDHWLDEVCRETYEDVMEMQRRGTSILIDDQEQRYEVVQIERPE